MKQPQFLRTADQLDKWLERFNPLRGATLGSLAGYFDEADEGRYANVMWMARRMIRRDETIRACCRRIRASLMKLKWTVKIMDTLPAGMSEATAERQKEALRQRYEQIGNLKAAYTASAMADLYGFAHLEKHYDARGQVTRLQPVPQWHWVRCGLYGEWKYNARATPWPHDAEPIEAQHYVIREVDDPWVEIALIHGLRKNQNDRDWDGFCARYGIPNTFFTAPNGATQEDLEELSAVAADMAADGAGALPNGADVKIHESGQKGEVFAAKNKRHDAAIVLAATGGLLTMLAESGSGTLGGSAHQQSWDDLVSGIAADVAEEFQEQLDKVWLAELFPGQPAVAYFELAFPEQAEDRTKIATTINTLAAAGYKAKREWVEEEMGIELEEAAAPSPTAVPPMPIKNRFAGGPTSARDRAEALQLAQEAIGEVLDARADMIAPLGPELEALIALVESDQATPADFAKAARKVESLLPELVTPEAVGKMAAALEEAMGTAAVLGARAGVRTRAKS